MGCNESAVTIQSNNTGNEPCDGYELATNLDFDTNSSGGPNSGDTYWNGGLGWQPIKHDGATPFTGEFHGKNGTTQYTISNLFIDRDATTAGTKYYAGLFGRIDAGAEIKNVKLTGVSVTLESATAENPQPNVYAGGLVGYQNAGTITGSSVVGSVKAVVKAPTPSTTATKAANAGGLVGVKKAGDIVSSHARANVTAEHKASAGDPRARAGGLVGLHESGHVIASHSAGSATAKVSSSNGNAYAGGLIGEHKGGDVKAAYSHASPKAANVGSSNASVSLHAAGLAAFQNGGNITASYSTGAPTIDAGSATVNEHKGGLVGRRASRNHNQQLLGYRTIRHNRDRAGDWQDPIRANDAHRLRNGRQRHLQGLGHRPRHDNGGNARRLELRNGVSAPRHKVRADARRPAPNRHPNRVADNHLGTGAYHAVPRQRRNHHRHAQQGAAERRRHNPADKRRLHPQRPDHHHRRRLYYRNRHPHGDQQPRGRRQPRHQPSHRRDIRRPARGLLVRQPHVHHQRRRLPSRARQRERDGGRSG